MANSGPARSQYWPSPSYTCCLGCWICVWASNKTEKKNIGSGENLANLEPEEKSACLVFSVAEALQELFKNRIFDGLSLMKILKMRIFHLKKIQIQVQIQCLESQSSTTCEYQLAMECNLCRLPFKVRSKHSQYENLEKFSLNSCYP